MHSLSGLKPIRALLNFDPQQLADRIGVEVNTYYRYERGERRIYLDKAATLAHMLDVPVDWLLTDPDTERRHILFERGEKRRQLLERGLNPDEEQQIDTMLTEWDGVSESDSTD